jgi:hypothetical protein
MKRHERFLTGLGFHVFEYFILVIDEEIAVFVLRIIDDRHVFRSPLRRVVFTTNVEPGGGALYLWPTPAGGPVEAMQKSNLPQIYRERGARGSPADIALV